METKKQKVVKILKRIGIALSVGFNVIFLIAIIIGSSGIKNKGNNVQVACAESEVIKLDSEVNKKFASYDDSNHSITLTANELNTNTFTNFNNFAYPIYNAENYFLDGLSYNGLSFTLNQASGENNHYYFLWTYDNGEDGYIYISFNYDGEPNSTDKFYFAYSIGEFTESVVLSIRSQFYDDCKSAIQLDLGESSGGSDSINDGIFQTLTSGIVAFIGSIGSGITAMTSVFYDSANSQLTTIGLLSVIVVAISLAYFLFRLIIGLIRLRG